MMVGEKGQVTKSGCKANGQSLNNCLEVQVLAKPSLPSAAQGFRSGISPANG